MRLPRFMRRLLRQPTTQESHRTSNLAKIEALGFKVEDLRGWHEGKFAPRRYRIVDPDGKIWDLDGLGFASSAEAYRGALAALEERNRAGGTHSADSSL